MKRNSLRISVLLLPLLLVALVAAQMGRADSLLFIGGTAEEVVAPPGVTDVAWGLDPANSALVESATLKFAEALELVDPNDDPAGLRLEPLVCVQVLNSASAVLANACTSLDTKLPKDTDLKLTFGSAAPAAHITRVNVSVIQPVPPTVNGGYPIEIIDVHWELLETDTRLVKRVKAVFAPYGGDPDTCGDNGCNFKVFLALQDSSGTTLAKHEHEEDVVLDPCPSDPPACDTIVWDLPLPPDDPGVSAEDITRFLISIDPADPWDMMVNVPDSVGLGAGMTTDGTHIYLQIGSRNRLYRFTPDPFNSDGGVWTQRNDLARAPNSPDQGAALVFAKYAHDDTEDNPKAGKKGYLYALRGGNKTDFWRYDIDDDSWTSMSPALAGVRWGGALTWDGADTIYAFRGETPDFWQYSISSNQWTPLDSAPGIVSAGGALVFVKEVNAVYALQGGPVKGEGSVGFWKYNVNTGQWQTTPPGDFPAPAGRGAALASDGDDAIYALRGNDTKEIWRYIISEDDPEEPNNNPWARGPLIPLDMREGGTLVFLGGDVYATQGRQQADFLRISPLPFTVYEPNE